MSQIIPSPESAVVTCQTSQLHITNKEWVENKLGELLCGMSWFAISLEIEVMLPHINQSSE